MSENRKIKFTTNKGVFVAEMFEDKAPLTTKNFIELVEKGFYDGIIFHRVIDGFMMTRAFCPWLMQARTPAVASFSSLWHRLPG